ncbi:DcaP family trimeric outer membrane transporter [Planctomicrobium piriforme]|uniref:Porin subfamily protein n=1 Tax=Planctomicrobium piriforme TaxID=1576369 RepID=A0A1I3F1B0_9PLAN|nr:DcaP family trimeric outer membrane transporter [Planctomicrobium piriforme]SFI04968.1 hypothetical protein SAMN05421753_10534 [Planctomicrobium piriforme]
MNSLKNQCSQFYWCCLIFSLLTASLRAQDTSSVAANPDFLGGHSFAAALIPPDPLPAEGLSQPAGSDPTQLAATAQIVVPPSLLSDPIPSSQQVPFTLPSTAGNGSSAAGTMNGFDGHPSIQDALSAMLPGNFAQTRYKWYGLVRLDGIFDFKPIGSNDDFVTSTIPVPQGHGRNATLTPRYTRLGLDTSTPSPVNDWTIKTRIEVDFFNGNEQQVFASFPLRVRFAWIEMGPLVIGQAASMFMDYGVFPNTLDYEGPGGMVLMRQPLIGLKLPVATSTFLSLGVEQPYSDIQWFSNGSWVVNPGSGTITTPGVDKNIQEMPDFTGNIHYDGDFGHAQVSSILRRLSFQSAAGESYNQLGYGVNLTGSFHPWGWLTGLPRDPASRNPWQRSRVLGQFAKGRGINRYIQDVNGLGLDAIFDPVTGFVALDASGWFVAYEQWWSQKLLSNFTYGQNRTDLPGALPANTYQAANYLSANLIWLPFERMGVGIETLYGERQNKDGQSGQACRIQIGAQYKF